ncbi:MAG: DUF5615 family PIN-like protein [Candidatus Contendobacter sp.]|nr:DUF5615 family PIN-like protein [Candidatus Contendobacter sp.]MDG4556184.1 DUF5615 family PIN-like protein [Candidatus Contendobacter sp.]
MARFLADENFLGDAVTALREAGHDIAWIRTDSPGSTDPEVLTRAVVEQRILLTFDKDFGDLAYRCGLPAACGIVLFRISLPSPRVAARLIKTVLQSRDDWAGHFSVVEENRLRMRALPPP